MRHPSLPNSKSKAGHAHVMDLLDARGQLSFHASMRMIVRNMKSTHVGAMHELLKRRRIAYSSRSPSVPAYGGLAESAHQVERLFPMPLPPRPASLRRSARDLRGSSRRAKRLTDRQTAWGISEMLVCFFNLWEVSSPDGTVDWEPIGV